MNQYEGMFLFDPTFATTFEACEAEVRRVMDRAGAEILFCKKWDDRRLAFRIKGRKRGVYVLTYFNAATDKIGGIERDVQLSEDVLRVLIIRADGVTPDLMEAAMTAQRRGSEDGDRPEYNDDGGDQGGGYARRGRSREHAGSGRDN